MRYSMYKKSDRYYEWAENKEYFGTSTKTEIKKSNEKKNKNDLQFKGLTQEQSDEILNSSSRSFAILFWVAAIGSGGLFFLVGGPFAIIAAIVCFIWTMLNGITETCSKINEDVKHQQLLNK